MCREFIHGSGKIGMRRPEPFITRDPDGVFGVEVIAFEPGTDRRRT